MVCLPPIYRIYRVTMILSEARTQSVRSSFQRWALERERRKKGEWIWARRMLRGKILAIIKRTTFYQLRKQACVCFNLLDRKRECRTNFCTFIFIPRSFQCANIYVQALNKMIFSCLSSHFPCKVYHENRNICGWNTRNSEGLSQGNRADLG